MGTCNKQKQKWFSTMLSNKSNNIKYDKFFTNLIPIDGNWLLLVPFIDGNL